MFHRKIMPGKIRMAFARGAVAPESPGVLARYYASDFDILRALFTFCQCRVLPVPEPLANRMKLRYDSKDLKGCSIHI